MTYRSKPCKSAGCNRPADARRGFCAPCRTANDRNADPIRYAHRQLKAHAKSRGIAFELTRAQFAAFAEVTDYLMKVGRTTTGYHIDRIDPNRGYCADNIRLLSASENSRKGAVDDKIARRLSANLRREYNPESRKMEFWFTHTTPALPPADCPF